MLVKLPSICVPSSMVALFVTACICLQTLKTKQGHSFLSNLETDNDCVIVGDFNMPLFDWDSGSGEGDYYYL